MPDFVDVQNNLPDSGCNGSNGSEFTNKEQDFRVLLDGRQTDATQGLSVAF